MLEILRSEISYFEHVFPLYTRIIQHNVGSVRSLYAQCNIRVCSVFPIKRRVFNLSFARTLESSVVRLCNRIDSDNYYYLINTYRVSHSSIEIHRKYSALSIRVIRKPLIDYEIITSYNNSTSCLTRLVTCTITPVLYYFYVNIYKL